MAVIVKRSVKLLCSSVFDNKTHAKGSVVEMDAGLAELYEKANRGVIVPPGTLSTPDPDEEESHLYKFAKVDRSTVETAVKQHRKTL